MLSARILLGAALLPLMLLLTACAAPSTVVTEYTLPHIPPAMLAECPHPEVRPGNAEGLAQGLVQYHGALEQCNNRITTIRDYLEGFNSGSEG